LPTDKLTFPLLERGGATRMVGNSRDSPEAESMLRFACPACNAVIRGPDRAGGTKVSCPQCGQRLLVPSPAKKRTMLGRLLPQRPNQAAPATAQVNCPGCQSTLQIALGQDRALFDCPLCGMKFVASSNDRAGSQSSFSSHRRDYRNEPLQPPLARPQTVPKVCDETVEDGLEESEESEGGSHPTSTPRHVPYVSRIFDTIAGIGLGCIVGYFSAHYFAIFGGFQLLGNPHSPARDQLVPGHMLLWALLLGVAGLGLGFLMDGWQGSSRSRLRVHGRRRSGHSVMGVFSVIGGGVSFVLILVSRLIYESWANSMPRAHYEVWYGHPPVPEYALPLPVLPKLCVWVMGLCVIVIVFALATAGLSFLSNTKRHWSIAGCVVNGLLLFWILFRMGML
jgi:predicted RNA-binding Zn-ribbon protein involved in translation (DUF1610 family)